MPSIRSYEKEKKMKFTFSDEILAAVAQCVQLGMLTGTDVVDHLRLLEVEADFSNDATDPTPQQLKLTPECKERHERNIADLLARAMEISKQMKSLDDGKAGQT